MKICPKCGQENADSSSMCFSCYSNLCSPASKNENKTGKKFYKGSISSIVFGLLGLTYILIMLSVVFSNLLKLQLSIAQQKTLSPNLSSNQTAYIVGAFLGTLITLLPGFILARISLRRSSDALLAISAMPEKCAGKSFAMAGKIIGIICMVILGLLALLVLYVIVSIFLFK